MRPEMDQIQSKAQRIFSFTFFTKKWSIFVLNTVYVENQI